VIKRSAQGADYPAWVAPVHVVARDIEAREVLGAVRRLSADALTTPSADAIVDALAATLFEVIPVDQVHFLHISDDAVVGHGLLYTRAGGAPEQFVQALEHQPSGVGLVVETGEPLNVPDARSAPHLRQDHVELWNMTSCLFVPLRFAARVRGVVILASHTPREFTPGEVELAATLSDSAAAGIALSELEERRRRESRQQSALARAAKTLNASLDVDAVLNALCEQAADALDADNAGVYLGDGTHGGKAVAGHNMPESWLGWTIRPGEGVSGQTLVSGEAVISNAYQDEVRLPDNPLYEHFRTAVSVPMRWGAELRGSLAVAFQHMRRITSEDIELLEAIADLASMACQNAQAFEQAQHAARTDSLTGVLNHGAMQVRLREEIARTRRERGPLSCLIIDLDNFKQLNDRVGHVVGDHVLQRVARTLRREFRPYDQLARYGGDEFVLILPGVGEEAATQVAERIRASVAAAGSSSELGAGSLEVSVGIAQWREPQTATELLERADRALLLAKRRGKARVTVSSPETDDALAVLSQPAAGGGNLPTVIRDFWDLVASCADPGEALATLPAFVRRSMRLEEVALFEHEAGAGRNLLRRVAVARLPGDPSPPAFVRPSLATGADLPERLAAGSACRGSLAELHRALDVAAQPLDAVAPVGGYAAVPLGSDGSWHVLFLRAAEREFPLESLFGVELLGRQAMTVLLGQSGGGSPAAVKALAAAIDARDNYTHAHSEEVVSLAGEVAVALELPRREIERIRRGALLHDVGKVAIPNEILYKPGPLTDDEWDVMRQHPVIGERILRRTPELADIAALVRHEHEHFDGSGYPDGLVGETIPIGARIVLACDAYSAMITKRPYREPRPPADAIAELERCAGTQFDPGVVDALVHVLAARTI
jgi:diguanylate cyclase (GGDEF)-like protein/putative nucleotidyltransferase with HDIG domain